MARSSIRSAVKAGGRGHWTQSEARRVLAELAASGESVVRFCAGRGLNCKRVYWWRARLRERDEQSRGRVEGRGSREIETEEVRFVPARVVSGAVVAEEISPAVLRLHWNDIIVDVPVGVDEATLTCVLRAVLVVRCG